MDLLFKCWKMWLFSYMLIYEIIKDILVEIHIKGKFQSSHNKHFGYILSHFQSC
jgi:hypothetical protein